MGLLGIGGFFVAVGAVQALVTKGQLASTGATAGAAISLAVGVGAMVGAGGMNAGRAWGWLVGVIVSSIIVAAGVVSLASASRGLGAALTLLTGILLVLALLLPEQSSDHAADAAAPGRGLTSVRSPRRTPRRTLGRPSWDRRR
jgi:hypothetical protein